MIEQQSGEQVYGAVAEPAMLPVGTDAVRGATAPLVTSRERLRPYQRAYLWISRAIIIGFTLLILFPVAAVVIASFSAGTAFYSSSLIPTHFTLQHYQDVLDPSQNFLTYFRNSAIVCFCTAIIAVLLVASTGYAFSRFRFYGRKYGLMSLLLIQMFPVQMSFVALYFLLWKIGLLNTLQGLILIFIGGGIPFNAWLFKGYVDGLPRELEESAYVDGATRFQAFWKIILPLTRPMMAVIFIFQFIGVYNDYIITNYMISDPSKWTVAVGLQQYLANSMSQNWTDFAAGAVIASLPIVAVFLLAQKWLVSGLAAGAVKG